MVALGGVPDLDLEAVGTGNDHGAAGRNKRLVCRVLFRGDILGKAHDHRLVIPRAARGKQGAVIDVNVREDVQILAQNQTAVLRRAKSEESVKCKAIPPALSVVPAAAQAGVEQVEIGRDGFRVGDVLVIKSVEGTVIILRVRRGGEDGRYHRDLQDGEGVLLGGGGETGERREGKVLVGPRGDVRDGKGVRGPGAQRGNDDDEREREGSENPSGISFRTFTMIQKTGYRSTPGYKRS